MTDSATLRLRRGVTHRCEDGHPWVYRTEFAELPPTIEPGSIVAVQNEKGRLVGRGFINPRSMITVRLMTTDRETPIDRDFLRARLAGAIAYRRRHLGEVEHARLVFGEADFLPGLVVDRYGPILCVQFLALGMEVRREEILDLLEELVAPAVIFERSDAPTRQKEGLAPRVGVVRGAMPAESVAVLNGLRFRFDLAGGQKTGFFFDQRQNLARLPAYIQPGARVLDCFSYVGSFALHAARAGAAHVDAVDISPEACAIAAGNAAENGLAERCTFHTANAFDLLRQWSDEGRRYDTVILDPPAFTKSREGAEGALRGYHEINLRALKMVVPGGTLITCSCSHHVGREAFLQMIVRAARDARRPVRILEQRSQSVDHPVLAAMPESEYLKFVALAVS
jgi:23S rRNA (cytosine1962-C5)-methyltransferase